MSFTTKSVCPGKTWKEREELILKSNKPLAIKDFSLTEYDTSLEDFIHNFLVSYNQKYKTATIGNLGSDQCSAGKLRSLIDIFLICKHYFYECTLEDVKVALYANQNMLSHHVCSTINRRVYWIRHTNTSQNHLDQKDEFGLTIKNYE